jgi:chromate transport protein ChrA
VERIFKGIRPCVVALILAPSLRMIKSAKVTWKTAIIPIATVFLIWWCKISPAYVILAAIAGSLIYALIIRRHETARRNTRDNGPSTGSGTSSRVSESRVPRQKEKEAKP